MTAASRRWSALLLLCAACTRDAPPAAPPDPHAASAVLDAMTARSSFTVVLFFSRHCSCVRVHDARLIALFNAYHPRGVDFIAVDPEIDASPAIDRAEQEARGYPFPIVVDAGAALARRYDAEYAAYVVLLDREKQVLFRGGIDSDRAHLRSDAARYLAEALDDVTRGAPVRRDHADTLGCTLRLR